MNKVYKVVWNASLGVWVAVSEIAKGKTKNSGSVGQTLSLEQKEPQSFGNLFFNYKALTLAIFAAFTADFAHAGYEAGGGTTRTNCTRTSNGTGSEAAAIAIANENSTACASAVEAIAIGANLAAQGAQSTVIGNDIISSTSAEQSVIIGSNYNSNPVTSNGKGGVAIGSGLSTTHSSPIADGQGSLALGSSGDGTTINGTTYNQQGPDAKAAYSAALMAGSQVATGADKSIAFGVDAKVSANIKDAIALGTGAVASVNNSVALGGGSTTTAPTGTGYITNTTAPTSVVSVGSSTNLRRIQNVADGAADQDAVTVAQLKDVNNRAVGNTTALGGGAAYDPSTNVYTAPTFTTTKTDGTTVNSNTVSGALTNLNNEVIKPITFSGNTGSSANKLGSTLNITGTGSTAGTYSGNNLKTSVSGNTVSIQMADAPVFTGTVTAGNLATGGTLSVTGVSNLNGGANLNNQKITNVAAGTASGDAVNFGQLTTTNNNVTTAQTTANSALAEAQKGINFGDGSTSNNYALGETINVKGDSNINSVTTADGVQLSLASDISVDSVTAGNSKLNNSGLTITGGPSITTAGIDAANTNISNVADATTADQAVNKGQLDAATAAADNKTDALGNSTANNLGGGATYDSTTGAVTAPTYTVNGTDVNNVGAAISELDKGWNLASNGANAGAIKAGDTVDIGTAAGETNLQVAKSGNTIQYSLSRDLDLDSVTAGNSKLNNSGLTITGGPSITTAGIDAANTNISNVADATTADQAVNKGQLDHVDNRVTQVTNTTASIFGGGAKANTDGSISNPTYNVAGTSANNVGDALTALDKAVTDAGTAANAGWTVSANGDAATAKNIKPNGKVNFTGDDNLTVAQSSETDNEGNIKVALNKNLKVDSVTTGNTVIDTTGVKVGNNVHLGSTGLIIAGGPSITTSGISAGNKTISNVAAGVSSTDAVNKGQLDSAISSINNNVGALANSAVQYDKNSDGSVNKDSITLAGGANGTTIKNVANGTVAEGSKDAVNGGQLWTVQQQVNKNTGDISNLQTDISNINNGKSGLVQQADKDAAITVGKDTGGTQVNVAGTAGERTVTGVKAGAVTESSKDAVNGSQLNTTNQALVNYLGGGAGYDNITQSFSNPTYNVGDQSYHNVGDAIGALNQADQTLNTKIDNVSNKLEQAFYATNQRIDDVEKRANAGIAAAMALENAPFVAGKYTYAVGAAYHGGENAVGVTLRKTADNGRWSLTGGVAAASQGDPSVRIGISGVID
ncbi:ESPR-type extended signal peptide-containing protein [Acinetobacter baumannii]|uniref:ESPR-type extended signal peptide-containing protein n=1 Tax=Acinetobacter baumannii TaxID=470 RepID=UPI000DE73B69|nr:ESPR-type extended signal peptide-containing protein [Acinetobacter baumannii]SST51428.1 autotransporter adhesin [Acinetobacter baumannii]SST51799.1 autotransporter adhesin [Acinetobacter baumannii]SSV07827.1 autotransporter adhesin [Acinetobacter baumannii]